MTNMTRMMKMAGVITALVLSPLCLTPLRAQDVFLGEIDLVPYTFAMKGFAECDGRLLPISQNTALFSLLGTMYGGDGKTTFALPDLRDRVPIHSGQGAGLSAYEQGAMGGEYAVSLTLDQLPPHAHAVRTTNALNNTTTTAQGSFGVGLPGSAVYRAQADTTMAPALLRATGGTTPHNNLQPYLGMKYVIALVGIFPSRP